MAFHISIVTCVLLSCLTYNVYSSCLSGKLSSQVTEFGTIDERCVFDNITVLPGSSFKLPAPQCLECNCTRDGLVCCGFGFSAGVVAAPEGCVAHNDACNLVFVKKSNPSEVCHEGKPRRKNKPRRKLPASVQT